MGRYVLRLYVNGRTPQAEQAIRDVRRMCDEMLGDQCECTIIDVSEHPQAAIDEGILLTPTLVKSDPPPAERVTGDLSSIQHVMQSLGMTRSGHSKPGDGSQG
jgi:circadian clock protein KaiB